MNTLQMSAVISFIDQLSFSKPIDILNDLCMDGSKNPMTDEDDRVFFDTIYNTIQCMNYELSLTNSIESSISGVNQNSQSSFPILPGWPGSAVYGNHHTAGALCFQ